MNKNYRLWFAFCLLLIPALACAFPAPSGSSGTATPLPLTNGGGAANGGGNPVPGSLTSTASPTPSPTPSASPTASPTPTSTPTLTPTPDRPSPYLVKQIETLGGEAISGVVCSTGRPFDVTYVTAHVTFVTHYLPQDASRGKWVYAYTIESAGESHDASGSYTLQPAKEAGVLLLSQSGSDHVVFKGFDGKMPSRYQFDLVPAGGATCP